MKLVLALGLLCLAVFMLFSQPAKANLIGWTQEEPGDDVEYRFSHGFGNTGWREFDEEWVTDGVHMGRMMATPPEVTSPGVRVELRAWRYYPAEDEWVMSESSPIPPRLYVSEPPLLLSLVVGIGALALTPTRSRLSVELPRSKRAASIEPLRAS